MSTEEQDLTKAAGWDAAQTSFHIQAAKNGADSSRDWVVSRFTPLLRAQAAYRISGPLKQLCEPDDLVNEVWMVVLPKLACLEARDGRWTPVLLRYLSTTMLYKVNHLLTKQITGRTVQQARDSNDSGGSRSGQEFEADVTGPSSGVERNEICERIHACIQRLEPAEREVIVLRGIEQLTNQAVADLLGEKHSAISMRYARALEKLRRWLPGSIFAELAD